MYIYTPTHTDIDTQTDIRVCVYINDVAKLKDVNTLDEFVSDTLPTVGQTTTLKFRSPVCQPFSSTYNTPSFVLVRSWCQCSASGVRVCLWGQTRRMSPTGCLRSVKGVS